MSTNAHSTEFGGTQGQGEVYETADQVLARVPICRRHLANLTRRGVIPSIRLGRRRLYPRTLLDRALARLAAEASR